MSGVYGVKSLGTLCYTVSTLNLSSLPTNAASMSDLKASCAALRVWTGAMLTRQLTGAEPVARTCEEARRALRPVSCCAKSGCICSSANLQKKYRAQLLFADCMFVKLM